MKAQNLYSLTILSVLLHALPAYSGGWSWAFRMETIREIGHQKYQIELTPIGEYQPQAYFPHSCRKVTLRTQYVFNSQVSNSFNKKAYEDAISFAKQATSENEIIRIGEFPSGLKAHSETWEAGILPFLWNQIATAFFGKTPPKNRDCKVQSRGLSILSEAGGTKATYSYYDPF